YTRKDFGDWENRRFPGLSTWFEAKIADDATAPKRAMMLDPTGETEVKITLTLPGGYTVTVPTDVKHTTEFAEYTSTYTLKGDALTMDRTMRYKVRELPVSEFGAYRDFVKAVSDDAGQMLQLVGASAVKSKTARPDNAQASELMEQVYQEFRAHNYKSAREMLDRVRALNDQQSGLWGEYGAIDWNSDKAQAIADYRKEIELHPETLFAYKDLTNLLRGEGRWPEAEQTLAAWAKADPADAQPHVQLGSLQLMQKQYKDAEKSLQDAIALSTKPEMLKMELGKAQLKDGDTDTGKATMHGLMDTSDDAMLLNATAYELADAGLDLPASEAASKKAIQILETKAAAVTVQGANNEDFANVRRLAANWDTLGWIYFKEKNLSEAESYVQSAWLLLLEDPEAGLHMGKIYEAEGKKDEALTTYRLAVKAMGERQLPQNYADMRSEMNTRATALKAAGAHEKPAPRVQQGGDELAALRTYTIPSPLEGQYASADFLLLLGDNRAEDVRFLKGDESLKKTAPALEAVTFHSPLPRGSKAKVLRRGIVACTTGSKTCLLVLLPPSSARMDN
ncbi:MAG TPA: tetratricopeptide repeat protein, partial [Acidobacteriaceae bacterium]|nr:tetratricopeptide repeat protein [Acidobacteriaceae bacterium]